MPQMTLGRMDGGWCMISIAIQQRIVQSGVDLAHQPQLPKAGNWRFHMWRVLGHCSMQSRQIRYQQIRSVKLQ
eukprot:scaffold2639_cov361-Pavlova_lutheri.AAC.56